jgi:tRNA nucleotidyltransferase (CCA-adding enzyme)
MEVITSHINADFDTFASMLAAKKLYPQARLVFSGSLESGLREALEKSRIRLARGARAAEEPREDLRAAITLDYAFEKAKEIDLSEVQRLILVDVRQPARIGRFSGILGREGLEVHIYDHHPRAEGDIPGALEATEAFGSTTTVLTRILMQRGIGVTPDEATVLMAGIYEDTGFLCYPSTTVEDYEAASHLLRSGADLGTVSALLRKELTPQEVALLDGFLRSEAVYAVGGVDVTLAEGYIERYEGDISVLAHKMMDIEGMDCLFMLADSEDRVHVIARSRTPRVDAGAVLRPLGGGGHPHAASATIKGVTLIQAREMLLDALRKTVEPQKTAADIMSSPPITVPSSSAIRDALELMRRYNINALPVVSGDGAVAGVITRQVADKAVYHGLSSSPAGDYMTTEFETVETDTSVEEIREKVIAHGARLLPVVREGRVAGVITRTDLIKLLQEGLREDYRGVAGVRVMTGVMEERLPPWVLEILADAGEAAERLGCKAYAVGGFVRDLLLRRENLDVDIVIEDGDGVAFAEEFARERRLKVRSHERFKTAVVIFPDGFNVDVATARLEYYERPGALPTVESSSLKLDLYRRDFVMNTLALALNPGRFGELIDFFGARKDIKEKTIRVLHNLSFVEDPTRALRAVRFSEKLGFRIGKHTLRLMKNSARLGTLREVAGTRLFEELKSIIEEETAVKSLRALHDAGLLTLVHGRITWDAAREAFVERARQAVAMHRLLYDGDAVEGWLTVFLALTDTLDAGELQGLVARLSISGRRRIEALAAREEGLKALALISSGGFAGMSGLYRLLKPLPLEVTVYLMAKAEAEPARKAFSTFITRLKGAGTELKGADLRAMGVEEGPAIGEALRLLLDKRLDGEIRSRDEEEEAVRAYLKSRP